ncbi:MAG: DNA primase [Candidatus Aminicenantales bacterium]
MEITEKIRQAASIAEIASQYTTLRLRGKKQVGLCPFHTEKTPSFTVDEEKQLFHCFGCGMGGDVFTLVMEKENLSFPEALKFLAQKYHIPLPQEKIISPTALKQEEQLLKINESALAFFKKNLYTTNEGKAALDYLKKRNISESTIQEFKLGYALNSWNFLLSYFTEKGVASRLLEKAGLVIPGKKKEEVYDRFRGRVIFPIFSLAGKVVGFGGRTLFNAEPKYLNSPETPVYFKGQLLYGLNFTKEAVRNAGEMILVEGYTDFTALYQAGVKNCAASLGTSLTSQQASLAQRFAPRIIINYDGDSAGRAAAQRAISLCFENGIQTQVLILPKNLDPDGFLQKHGREAYSSLMKKSVSGLKFLIDTAVQGKHMDIPEVKTKVLKDILKELENISDSVLRSEYLKKTSEYLSVDEALLRSLTQKKPAEMQTEIREFLLPAEKRLLQILFEKKDLRPSIFAEMEEEDFRGLKSEAIFKIMIEQQKKEKDLVFQELKQDIGSALSMFLAQALIEKGKTPTVSEARDCLRALRIWTKENRIKELQVEIARLEKKGDEEKVRSLQRQKRDLTMQILPDRTVRMKHKE